MRQIMKYAAALFIVAALFSTRLMSQTSNDVPRIISYQGQINTTSGLAMNGTHTITATLYSDPHGKNSVWHGSYDAVVTNGIFNITLGSGKTPLPDVALINRSLWIGLTVDNGEEMQPRTQLSSAPYALNVPDKSITAEKLSDDLRLNMLDAGNHQTVQNVTDPVLLGGQAFGAASQGDEWIGSNNNFEVWFKTNSDVVMRYIPTTSTSLTPNIIGGSSVNFINGSPAGSIICGGGSSSDHVLGAGNIPNYISKGNYDVITGGANHYIDTCNFSFIGGGYDNQIVNYAHYSTIGGGFNSLISFYDSCSFVGGGYYTSIDYNSPFSSMVGGKYNTISHGTEGNFLGGGFYNTLDTATSYSVIVGGYSNIITHSNTESVIGGGYSNFVKSSLSSIVGGDTNLIDNSADHSFIGGGRINAIKSTYGVIGGGDINVITSGSSFSFIGSGYNNSISVPQSVIGGGDGNVIDGFYSFAPYSDFIGSGSLNYINGTRDGIVAGDSNRIFGDNQNSFIGSGYHNMINGNEDVICGGDTNVLTDQSSNSFIGGGRFNIIKSTYNVIVGGDSNLIDVGEFPSRYNFVGGGLQNVVEPGCDWNAIGGGRFNHQGGALSFIGGGESNHIFDDCVYGVIVGGRKNYIGNESHQPAGQAENLSFIGGGDTNTINSKWDVIGGGLLNHIASMTNFSVITGGDSNLISNNVNNGTIGGGHQNVITEATANDGSGKFATIPGGDSLWAQSYGQTVVGVFNNKRGGSTASNFTTDISNPAVASNHVFDPLFIVGNGAPNARSNAFEVSNNGHSVVFDESSSGGATPTVNVRYAIKGATCTDNIIDAWAHMKWNSTGIGTGNRVVLADYGVTSITRTGPGVYSVALNIKDVTGTTYTLKELAVTVTMCDDGSEQSNGTCTIPVVVLPAVKNNTFTINVFTSGGCSAMDHSFMFHVTGR